MRRLLCLILITWIPGRSKGLSSWIPINSKGIKSERSLGFQQLMISSAREEEQTLELSNKSMDLLYSLPHRESSIPRAMEICGVIGGDILAPLVLSLLQNGIPSNWEEFWSLRSNSKSTLTNGERLTMAAESLGPTYVKFGQALASRPDVIPTSLAKALEKLQDGMEPFDTTTARDIIRAELQNHMDVCTLESLLQSLGDTPVGAASIGQVYKGYLPNYGNVAVKVKRRGIRDLVESDARLLRSMAAWIESIPSISINGKGRLVATELVDAVEEFFSRIFEELDYRREAANCLEFGQLYSSRHRKVNGIQVIIPEILTQYCTDNVLVMEWLEGTKLTDVDMTDKLALKENMRIISIGISCTLSQLLETGVSSLLL
jgi:predicted unusual protein kinase regulating ubiquinone biosynthesis (AarF/ABC1/UbiB family)